MFAINERLITTNEWQRMTEHLSKQEPFKDIGKSSADSSPHFIAICSSNAALVVSAVLFLRNQNSSVLLIYGETPLETALSQATQAGCSWLIYEEAHQYYRLNSDYTTITIPPPPPAPSLCQFSSGTTGAAKLVARPWGEVQTEIVSYNAALSKQGLAEAVPIILSSVTHSYGLIAGVLSAKERGVQPIIAQSNNPKHLLKLIQAHSNHLIYAVPAQLLGISEWLTALKVSLQALVTSGAPMNTRLFRKLQEQTKLLIQQYGCSEIGAASLAFGMRDYNDLGLPLDHIHFRKVCKEPSELRILLPSGKTISTGDLGSRTDDGRLYFHGRIDDLIIVCGLKVQPVEVEVVLNQRSDVREAVVYRGVHPVMGDMVKAQIIPAPGSHITTEKIRNCCRLHLPVYKVPHDIQIVDQIPRLPGGKVSRRLLEQIDQGGIKQ